jgi:hypothetical protein
VSSPKSHGLTLAKQFKLLLNVTCPLLGFYLLIKLSPKRHGLTSAKHFKLLVSTTVSQKDTTESATLTSTSAKTHTCKCGMVRVCAVVAVHTHVHIHIHTHKYGIRRVYAVVLMHTQRSVQP